ncbi:MAG: NADH-quinone oxidoreductase subunit J [Phycisphaeraceae bacterium]|nr:NADH-quinone oxidoreductase subunit J [Phycisphaeraceae bacterium]
MSPSIQIAIYLATGLGALAVYMMAPRRGYSPTRLGGLLGVMTLGGVWLALSRELPALGSDAGPMAYYYIFSAIAIGSGVRVITHQRPVYSALWFVMLVLASGGLLLVLEAPFIAAAMIIIYAGAILVTYVFVIMLASSAGDATGGDVSPEYERAAREPLAAVAVGFLLLAALLTGAFKMDVPVNPEAAGASDAQIIASELPNRRAARLIEGASAGDAALLAEGMPQARELDNIEKVGLDLFRGHLLGLELAGVLLSVSLVGAVVLARQRVPETPTTHRPPA